PLHSHSPPSPYTPLFRSPIASTVMASTAIKACDKSRRSWRVPAAKGPSACVTPQSAVADTTETAVIAAHWPKRSAAHIVRGKARSEEHTSELQSLAYLVC